VSKRYKLVLTPQAHRMFKKMPGEVQRICLKAFDRIESNPFIGKALLYNLLGYYSFRTTSYRIIYKIDEGRIIITVAAIGHRREIYEKLKRILG